MPKTKKRSKKISTAGVLINLPHIFYKVRVLDVSESQGKAKEMLDKFLAVTEKKEYASNIYIRLPIKPKDIPTLCHELVHVLQNICEDRDILFTNEEEHCAYLFQYMLNEILGYEYKYPVDNLPLTE